MNYYALETQMFEKQRDLQRKAERRRLVAAAPELPVTQAAGAPRLSVRRAVAKALRAVVAS
jgi:hypothetical protein